MALIFMEGFDRYYRGDDLLTNGWVQQGGSVPVYTLTSRTGVGQALNFSGAVSANPIKVIPSIPQEFYLGCASNGSYPIEFRFLVVNYPQLRIVQSAQNINVYRSTGTLLASTSSSPVPSSGWYFLEIGAKIDPTVGWVTIKINGTTVLTVTGVNTRDNATLSYIDSMLLVGAFDDMYMLDSSTGPGAHPMNTFIGEKRVATVYPTSSASTQFTNNGVINAGYYSAVNIASRSTGTIYASSPLDVSLASWLPTGITFPRVGSDPRFGSAPKMGTSGFINTLNFGSQASPAAKVKGFIVQYDSVNNVPVGTITYTNELTGVVDGKNTLTFPGSGAPVTKDVIYCFGFISDTAIYFTIGSDSPHGFTATASYASPPSTWTGGSVGVGPAFTYTQTVTNAQAVMGNYMDEDRSYNSSGNTSDVDLFNTSAGISASATIYAVAVKGEYRLDSGSRTAFNQLKSGGTTATGATRTLTSSYLEYDDQYVQDPNTSADWTVAAVNALQIGYKVGA